jgi:cytochrome c553
VLDKKTGVNVKHNTFIAIVFLSGVIGSQNIAQAQSEKAKTLSMTCIGCHGAAGVSPNPLWPNLAGQKSEYLAKQLLAFREQTRKDPMMNPITQSLSDTDINELAGYFSQLDPAAK